MRAQAVGPNGRDSRTGERGSAILMHTARFAYGRGPVVLDIDDLSVQRGEKLFIHGPSGSGKTTLLGLVAGVLRPTAGSVHVLGTDLGALTNRGRDALRAAHIGYIFQLFNLIPYLTVEENITLPCRLSRERRDRLAGASPEQAARVLAGSLEIGGVLHEPVTALSVGQQQRVAAARALIGAPELVIADEPTSSLDSDRRERFIELLFERCAEAGATLIFVSHDRQLERLFDRALQLTEFNRAAAR